MIQIDCGCPGAAHTPINFIGGKSGGSDSQNHGYGAYDDEQSDFSHFSPPYFTVNGVTILTYHKIRDPAHHPLSK
jgi:hypothetical protein